MKVPNQYRETRGVMFSNESFGNNGFFVIPISGRTFLHCIASDGEGWEHVSVVAYSDKKQRTPTWSEMSKINDMFWDETDCVIQYHPPKSEYVNNHPNCLHLCKPINIQIPTPPSILVVINS